MYPQRGVAEETPTTPHRAMAAPGTLPEPASLSFLLSAHSLIPNRNQRWTQTPPLVPPRVHPRLAPERHHRRAPAPRTRSRRRHRRRRHGRRWVPRDSTTRPVSLLCARRTVSTTRHPSPPREPRSSTAHSHRYSHLLTLAPLAIVTIDSFRANTVEADPHHAPNRGEQAASKLRRMPRW